MKMPDDTQAVEAAYRDAVSRLFAVLRAAYEIASHAVASPVAKSLTGPNQNG